MSLVDGSTAAGLTVRIVGSTGIRLHCPDASATMDAVERPAKDIDLVVRHGDRGRLRDWLEQRGWVVDRDLLVAMEGERYAFHHPDAGLDLDVFVEKLEFCHTIELDGRWERHATTLSIEDLLLQKLQVGDRAPRAAAGTVKLRAAIDETQKSRGWRMRARVGERMQWWEDVSEREDTY